MPDDLPVLNCDIKSTTGAIKFPVNCDISGGFVVLTNPFESDAFQGDQQMSIVFRGLQLPNSERMIKGITVETYDYANNKHWLVD